ncbi:MAG: AraC family transcriptional regulator [Clostridia bacterium]|nr:AraC family transcriptional regulator [Clostridia bacterium]
MTLAGMYHPITAAPFQQDDTYREVLPCAALRPYIRCFWGTAKPMAASGSTETGLVIPDTCMDIIFDVNYTKNRADGFFCALDEHSYRSGGGGCSDVTATFAIRFYAWTAAMFTGRDFSGTKNRHFSIGEFFGELRRELAPRLPYAPTLAEKIAIAEPLLLKHLRPERADSDLLNAVYYMLKTDGRARISELCSYAAVSERKLERLFDRYMGIAPKAFSSLIRYQLLWQDIALSGRFDVLDAVEKYGYTDQSHLLHDFKRHHLLGIRDAVIFAQKTRR